MNLAEERRLFLNRGLGQAASLQDSMDDKPTPAPQLVKKVAVTYDLRALPPYLIQSFNVLRRKLERSGYSIEVALRPLNSLPPEVDVLFVPTDLEQEARLAAPGVRIMLLTAGVSHQPAYDDLLRRLDAGQEIYAQRPETGPDRSDGTRRVLRRYRGNERID